MPRCTAGWKLQVPGFRQCAHQRCVLPAQPDGLVDQFGLVAAHALREYIEFLLQVGLAGQCGQHRGRSMR